MVQNQVTLHLNKALLVATSATQYTDVLTNKEMININAFTENPKMCILLVIPKSLIESQKDKYNFCNPSRHEAVQVIALGTLQQLFLYEDNLSPVYDPRFSVLVDTLSFGDICPISDSMKSYLGVTEGPIRITHSSSTRKTGTNIVNMTTDADDTEYRYPVNTESVDNDIEMVASPAPPASPSHSITSLFAADTDYDHSKDNIQQTMIPGVNDSDLSSDDLDLLYSDMLVEQPTDRKGKQRADLRQTTTTTATTTTTMTTATTASPPTETITSTPTITVDSLPPPAISSSPVVSATLVVSGLTATDIATSPAHSATLPADAIPFSAAAAIAVAADNISVSPPLKPSAPVITATPIASVPANAVITNATSDIVVSLSPSTSATVNTTTDTAATTTTDTATMTTVPLLPPKSTQSRKRAPPKRLCVVAVVLQRLMIFKAPLLLLIYHQNEQLVIQMMNVHFLCLDCLKREKE